MKATLAVLLVAATAACAATAPVAESPAPEEPRTVAPAPAAAALDPVGHFEFSTTVNGSPTRGTLHISGTPGAYTGRLSAEGMSEMPVSSVSVQGQQMTVQAETPDGPVTIRMNFTGDSFTGGWSLGGMSGDLSGRRVR